MFSLDFHCKENDGIIEFGEQPEVAESREPQEYGFSPKSLNKVREICWSIAVMEAPIVYTPLLRSLASHSIT